jgi:FkbM family methyltransferase
MNIDIRIVNALRKLLDKYIDTRHRLIQVKKNRKWSKKFIKQNKFIHRLNGELLINIYEDSLLCKLIVEGFEEAEICFLRRFLRPSDIFIDIGSNIGLFSIHAANIVGEKGSVFAYEPTPKTFTRLIENIQLNNLENIKAFNIGLSDSKGTLTLNVSSSGFDAWNTFAGQEDSKFSSQIDIPVESLDDIYQFTFKENKSSIALIKIDVEGWERHVLIGAQSILKKQDAPVLMVEFTETNLLAAGTNCYEIYDLVASYGYKWYAYDFKENILSLDPKRIHYPYNNLFAIKNLNYVNSRLNEND